MLQDHLLVYYNEPTSPAARYYWPLDYCAVSLVTLTNGLLGVLVRPHARYPFAKFRPKACVFAAPTERATREWHAALRARTRHRAATALFGVPLETVALRPGASDACAADVRRGVFAVAGLRLENGTLRETGVLESGSSGSGDGAVRTAVFAWRPSSSSESKSTVTVDVPVFLNETRRQLLFTARVPVAMDGDKGSSSAEEAAAAWCRRAVALTCWQQQSL